MTLLPECLFDIPKSFIINIPLITQQGLLYPSYFKFVPCNAAKILCILQSVYPNMFLLQCGSSGPYHSLLVTKLNQFANTWFWVIWKAESEDIMYCYSLNWSTNCKTMFSFTVILLPTCIQYQRLGKKNEIISLVRAQVASNAFRCLIWWRTLMHNNSKKLCSNRKRDIFDFW